MLLHPICLQHSLQNITVTASIFVFLLENNRIYRKWQVGGSARRQTAWLNSPVHLQFPQFRESQIAVTMKKLQRKGRTVIFAALSCLMRTLQLSCCCSPAGRTTDWDIDCDNSKPSVAKCFTSTIGCSAKSVLSCSCKRRPFAEWTVAFFCRKQRIYRIPEEQSPGTVVANITAKDPDDEDSPSRLFYSIQSSDTYFSINPCKTNKNIPSDSLEKVSGHTEDVFAWLFLTFFSVSLKKRNSQHVFRAKFLHQLNKIK